LTQPISVSGRAGAVIGRSVALDTEQVSTRRIGVNHRKIEKEASRPNLRMDNVTPLL
jgi:hypothetical protein